MTITPGSLSNIFVMVDREKPVIAATSRAVYTSPITVRIAPSATQPATGGVVRL